MHNFFREYLIVRNRIVENRQIFEKIKKYLLPGEYINNPLANILYEAKDKLPSLSTFDTASSTPNILLKKLVKKERFIKSKDEPVLFYGAFLVISSSRREYKIFSKNKVLTYYTYLEKMDQIINSREKFQNYFLMPKICEVDYEKNFIVEEFINSSKSNEKFPVDILNSYLIYAQKQKKIENNIIWDELLSTIKERHRIEIDISLLYDMPVMLCHGDFWSSNIIFNGENYYLTDFENVCENYFLYDFFMYVFNEYMINNDSSLLDMYFNGQYNWILEDLFNVVDRCYNDNYKNVYFGGFLLIIYSQRWANARSYQLHKKIDFVIRKYLNEGCNNER